MKKGISLISLIIVIIIMIILAGVILITGFGTTEVVTLNTFAIEILNIQNAVDEYYYRYEKYPAKDDYTLDITTIPNEFVSQFDFETSTDGVINFKTIDLSLIGIKGTEFGKGEGKDLYVLSEDTGKIYYINGVTYEEKTYYTLTDELYTITETNNNSGLIYSNDVKVKDVIFTPSTTEYTNQPITVSVKLPIYATVDSITVSEGKSISEETTQGTYKIYSINETSEDKDGNYTIQVNYTYGDESKVAEYSVATFDNTAPQLTTTTTIKDGIKAVKISATDDLSGVKVTKYEEVEIEDDTHFENYGKVVNNSQLTLSEHSAYTIYVKDLAGNYSTVVEIGESAVPTAWRENITVMYNTVPIPKGFVASHATGENTKESGLVIYEGTEEVTDENVEEAWTTRNQYVWVPVDDFSKFVRKYMERLSNVLGTLYWEVAIDEDTNMPLATQDTTYVSAKTAIEAQKMYASVKKYGGFYVGRYEAGIDKRRVNSSDTLVFGNDNVHSKMGKLPYVAIKFAYPDGIGLDTGGAVEVARGLYTEDNNSYGLVSTLIYGVQWDAVLQWWLDTKAVQSVTESSTYSNNEETEIGEGDLNLGARYGIWTSSFTQYYDVEYSNGISTTIKPEGTKWLTSTGALKRAKVNNIYDMAGNTSEYTMEQYTNTKHIIRASNNNVSARTIASIDYADIGRGIRVALYIK